MKAQLLLIILTITLINQILATNYADLTLFNRVCAFTKNINSESCYNTTHNDYQCCSGKLTVNEVKVSACFPFPKLYIYGDNFNVNNTSQQFKLSDFSCHSQILKCGILVIAFLILLPI